MRHTNAALFLISTLFITACGTEKPNLGKMPDDIKQGVPPPPFPYEDAKALLFSNALADFTCLVNIDQPSEIKCWGDNTHGQISGTAQTSKAAPVTAIPNLPQMDIANVFIGKTHACTLYLDNSIWCWGDNSKGQIHSQLEKSSSVPVTKIDTNGIFGEGDIRTGAAGDAHTCVVVKDAANSIWCWGDNSDGQVSGNGVTSETLSFTNVSKSVGLPADSVNALAAGYHYTCAAYTSEGVWCWGRNDSNQVTGEPNGDRVLDESVPIAMPVSKIDGLPREGLLELKAGRDHICAMYDDGSLWCWGDDNYAQVSAIRKTVSVSPGLSMIPNLPQEKPLALAVGQNFTCSNFKDGSLWCWGRNEFGNVNAIGKEGAMAQRLTHVTPVLQSVYLAAGANHVCASYVDGTVSCWGQDTNGQVTGTGKPGNFIQSMKFVSLDGSIPDDRPEVPEVPDVPDEET